MIDARNLTAALALWSYATAASVALGAFNAWRAMMPPT